MDNPEPVFVFRGSKDPITSISFMETNSDDKIKHLGAGTQAGHCILWNLKSKGIAHQWKAHEDTALLWLQNKTADEIWTQGRNENIKLWDINNFAEKAKLSYLIKDYNGFSPSDSINVKNNFYLLATPGPGQDGVTIWDTRAKNSVSILKPKKCSNNGTIMQMKWVAFDSSLYILVAYEGGQLSLWDWSNGEIFREICLPENPMCIAVNNAQSEGICGSPSEKHFSFSLSKENGIILKDTFSIVNPGISSCCFRPDDKIFAAGSWDNRIRLFRCKKNKALAVLLYHKQSVQCMAYSKNSIEYFPPGFLLACGSLDCSISLWRLYS